MDGRQIQIKGFVIKCRTADMQLYVPRGVLSRLAESAAGYRRDSGGLTSPPTDPR